MAKNWECHTSNKGKRCQEQVEVGAVLGREATKKGGHIPDRSQVTVKLVKEADDKLSSYAKYQFNLAMHS